jgi:hypothetical protein
LLRQLKGLKTLRVVMQECHYRDILLDLLRAHVPGVKVVAAAAKDGCDRYLWRQPTEDPN